MYLIFTEDDGWHTNQLVDAFNKIKKDVRLIKINETSIAINNKIKLTETKNWGPLGRNRIRQTATLYGLQLLSRTLRTKN